MEHNHSWGIDRGLRSRRYGGTEETRQQENYCGFDKNDNQDDYVKSYSSRKCSPRRYDEVHHDYEDKGYQQERKGQKKKSRKSCSMQNNETSDIPGYDHVRKNSSGDTYHTSSDFVSKPSSNVTNVINITNYQRDPSPKRTQRTRWDQPSDATNSNTLSIAGRSFEVVAETNIKNSHEDRLYGGHSIYLNAMENDIDSSKPWTSEQSSRRFDDIYPYEQEPLYTTHRENNDQRMGPQSTHNSQTYDSYGCDNKYVNSKQDGTNSVNTLSEAGRNFQEFKLHGGHNMDLNTMQDDTSSNKPVTFLRPNSPSERYLCSTKNKPDTSMNINEHSYKQVQIGTVDQHNTLVGNDEQLKIGSVDHYNSLTGNSFKETASPNFQNSSSNNFHGFHNAMQDSINSSRPNTSQHISRNFNDVHSHIQGPIGAVDEHNPLAEDNFQETEPQNTCNSHSNNLYGVHSTDVDEKQNNINSEISDTSQHSLPNIDNVQRRDQKDVVDEHIKNIYNESLREKKIDTSAVDESLGVKNIDASAVDEHIKHIYDMSVKEKEKKNETAVIDEHIQNIYSIYLKDKKSEEDICSSSSPVKSGENVYGSDTY